MHSENKNNKKPQQIEGIDFSEWISEDELIEISDDLKGLVAIIDSLGTTSETSDHAYSKQAYLSLSTLLIEVINKTEVLKPKLDYMGNICRYGVEYANSIDNK